MTDPIPHAEPITQVGQSPQDSTAAVAEKIGAVRIGAVQYNRKLSLIVAAESGDGLDLSMLRVVFRVQHWTAQTASIMSARVYNMKESDAQRVKKEFTQVILRAGYVANFGVIFQGTVKQVRMGRENPVDTYVDIFAADGDQPHNWGVVNTTLSAGYTPEAVNKAVQQVYGPLGVGGTALPASAPAPAAPRGKAMFGLGREYLRDLGTTYGLDWRIRGGVLEWLPQTAYKPGEAVVLTTGSGMIGTPQQTEDGVAVRMLLNPVVDTGIRIWINNKGIVEARRQIFGTETLGTQIIPDLSRDGLYKVLWADHHGDTRGNDWYTDAVTLAVDATVLPVTDAVRGVGVPP